MLVLLLLLLSGGERVCGVGVQVPGGERCHCAQPGLHPGSGQGVAAHGAGVCVCVWRARVRPRVCVRNQASDQGVGAHGAGVCARARTYALHLGSDQGVTEHGSGVCVYVCVCVSPL